MTEILQDIVFSNLFILDKESIPIKDGLIIADKKQGSVD